MTDITGRAGTQSMVEGALDAAGISDLARDTYVADAVKKFKPAPEIYAGLLKATGKESAPEECWLVSGNPFDVTGALAQGMSTIWVDRARKGWTDGLLPLHAGGATGPTKIVHGLVEIADFVAAFE
ncbi:hypothetical protein M0805_002629 [Coniferiporia weirii]|nr:hypothetical protein M0805_002629 [Coniferiporia weirii]